MLGAGHIAVEEDTAQEWYTPSAEGGAVDTKLVLEDDTFQVDRPTIVVHCSSSWEAQSMFHTWALERAAVAELDLHSLEPEWKPPIGHSPDASLLLLAQPFVAQLLASLSSERLVLVAAGRHGFGLDSLAQVLESCFARQ